MTSLYWLPTRLTLTAPTPHIDHPSPLTPHTSHWPSLTPHPSHWPSLTPHTDHPSHLIPHPSHWLPTLTIPHPSPLTLTIPHPLTPHTDHPSHLTLTIPHPSPLTLTAHTPHTSHLTPHTSHPQTRAGILTSLSTNWRSSDIWMIESLVIIPSRDFSQISRAHSRILWRPKLRVESASSYLDSEYLVRKSCTCEIERELGDKLYIQVYVWSDIDRLRLLILRPGWKFTADVFV